MPARNDRFVMLSKVRPKKPLMSPTTNQLYLNAGFLCMVQRLYTNDTEMSYSAARLDHIKELLHRLADVRGLIQAGGLPAVCLIVFVETGLFAFFLPGDSLLVTAGVFAHLGLMPLPQLLV